MKRAVEEKEGRDVVQGVSLLGPKTAALQRLLNVGSLIDSSSEESQTGRHNSQKH